jgi:hypothetical protein
MYFLLCTVWTVNDVLGMIIELQPRAAECRVDGCNNF